MPQVPRQPPKMHADRSSLCRDIVHSCPFPTAAFEGVEQILLYANLSFCNLAKKKENSLKGRSASECLPNWPDCLALLCRVKETGAPAEDYGESRSIAAWPIRPGANITVLQITRTPHLQRSVARALLATALKQHEKAEVTQASIESMGKTIIHQEQELDHTKGELRSLTLHLLQAQEEERKRIARELHDVFSQQLALIAMELSHLHGKLTEETNRSASANIQKQVDALSAEMRAMSHNLHSSALEDLGLVTALRGLLQDFERMHSLPVRLVLKDAPEDVPLPVATALFRIVQESLWNVVKHAGRDLGVTVRLSRQTGLLRLSVEDTGAGFDFSLTRGRGGLGLISMHERALSVGGSMKLISSPGEGTTVQITVPDVSGTVSPS